MRQTSIDLSVVIPVYNAERSLYELHSRIAAALGGRFRYEVIYVNDASTDGSLRALHDIRRRGRNVRVLNRRVNKGQHEAVILGLKYARGSLIANIDDDLQHDPAMIPRLADALAAGKLDIVYAVPGGRGAPFGSRLRDALFAALFRMDPTVRVSSFRVYTRTLADRVLRRLRPFNYFSALVFWRGENERPVRARSIAVPARKRKYGRSNYSFVKKFKVFAKIFIYYNPWRRR